jgi:hypothetical protein
MLRTCTGRGVEGKEVVVEKIIHSWGREIIYMYTCSWTRGLALQRKFNFNSINTRHIYPIMWRGQNIFLNTGCWRIT